MADSKAETIKVNVTKKSDKPQQRARRDGEYLGQQAAGGAKDDTDDAKATQASHQGKIIQPTAAAEAEAEGERTEAQAPEGGDTPQPAVDAPAVASNPVGDAETSQQPETEPTVADHATQQPQTHVDNRDYKISKKQLKKAPQTSAKHAHKTWVFLVLVTLVSLGLAYGYLTVVEGMSFSEITTKLGL